MRRTGVPGDQRGFTLAELLVVISIIALLIGILLPTLSGARRTAQQTRCIANLRSVTQASMLYASAHDGSSPALGKPWGASPFWAIVVLEQSGVVEGSAAYRERSVLVCPTAERRYGPGMTRTYAANVTGHAGAPGDPDDFDAGPAHIDTWDIDRPAETAWYLDSSPAAVTGSSPPPTRTISTIDFRDPDHVPARIGFHHGARAGDGWTVFNVSKFDGSVVSRAEVPDHWANPLP